MIDKAIKAEFRDATKVVFYAIENAFGIKPRIALMQSALESNWGASQLAIDGKNIFSLTPGDAWCEAINGLTPMETVPNWSVDGKPIVTFPTKEYSKFPPEKIKFWSFHNDIIEKKEDGKGGSILMVKRPFRKYANWNESAWDWARKLVHQKRYESALLAAQAGDVLGFADQIRIAGYATDPAYTTALIATSKQIDELPEAVA